VSHPKIGHDVHIESGARNAVQRSGQRTTNQILDAQALQNAGHSQSHFDRLGRCHRELGSHAFRIPAERPYHCRPINGHRCESQLGFTSVDAGMSQPNPDKGELANIPGQRAGQGEFLDWRHMAKSVDAPCFDGIVCIGQPVPHVHSIIPLLLREFIPTA
jgi:hypothetical protein